MRGGGVRSNRLVPKHPDGRSLEVIELALAGRPDESDQADQNDAQRHRDQDEEDRHGTARKVSLRQARRITVTELTGIMIAAISGLMAPLMANPAPIRL